MRRFAPILAAAALGLFAATPASGAGFALQNFDVTYTGPAGETLTQAGAHPFAMTTSFEVPAQETDEGGEEPLEAVRDAIFTQMEGFAASPTAVPTCSSADFLTPDPTISTRPSCPDSAAVGLVANRLGSLIGKGVSVYSPVYNLEPAPGVAGRLGFWVTPGIPVTIDAGLSEDSPHPIVAASTYISQVAEFLGTEFTLWGVPADPAHDPLRGLCLNPDGKSLGKCKVSIAEVPFITMPRACEGPLATTYKAISWLGNEDSGGTFTHDEAGNPQGMSGCGALSFSPHLSAQATSRRAASPSGMDIDTSFTDEGLTNPAGLAASDVERAVLTFPEGVTLNPSQAEGLKTCNKDELARETASSAFGAGCPAESKVGTVEAETPLLKDEVLRGSIFVATPYENLLKSSVDPLGPLIAVYMTLKEPERGISISLAARVSPDPATGRLVATLGDGPSPIPQAPVSAFRVHLREGGRSPLITPRLCGKYTSTLLLTPTADPAHPVPVTSSFEIEEGVGGGGCAPGGTPPFEPGFSAGTLTNGAATHSPFFMRLTRRDGDQDLTKFAATLPPGVLASLVGVSKCSDAGIAAARARTGPHGGAEELASPSCPADSKIGTTLAGAGVGSQLTYVPGSLYLAGPYNGAPLSVVSITPGVAGPFDVGTVVVRVALGFDPQTAQARADGSRSDPIPHILRGIPLAVRDLRVSVDRPGWIFNPTSCAESATRASIFGSAANIFDPADDVPIARSARFQASDCLSLGFGPEIGLRLKGGTKRGAHPALTATYTARSGDANLRDLSLLFPRSAFVENANFRTICTRKAFAANSCPPGSVYGHVTAHTPLLEEPLSGPVYLRSSDNELPDAVLALHGIVDVEVPIRIDSFKQRLRATVKNAPDAPVSKVVVQMQGAKKGLFVNSQNLCAAKNRAQLDLTAQSTKKLRRNPVVKPTGCGGKGAKHKRVRR